MAINIIQPKTEVKGSKGRSGGGKTGSMLGALAGAAIAGGAAVATGGAALPVAAAALGGAGSGAGLGGMIGGAVDPGKVDTRQAIQKRVQGMGQTISQVDPAAELKQSIAALREINNPELTKQYAPPLAQALIKSFSGDGVA